MPTLHFKDGREPVKLEWSDWCGDGYMCCDTHYVDHVAWEAFALDEHGDGWNITDKCDRIEFERGVFKWR